MSLIDIVINVLIMFFIIYCVYRVIFPKIDVMTYKDKKILLDSSLIYHIFGIGRVSFHKLNKSIIRPCKTSSSSKGIYALYKFKIKKEDNVIILAHPYGIKTRGFLESKDRIIIDASAETTEGRINATYDFTLDTQLFPLKPYNLKYKECKYSSKYEFNTLLQSSVQSIDIKGFHDDTDMKNLIVLKLKPAVWIYSDNVSFIDILFYRVFGMKITVSLYENNS